MNAEASFIEDRRSDAPPISPSRSFPRRHQRSRRKGARTPEGVLYCGRPTIRGNPFSAKRFGHARSVRLFRAWLKGRLGALTLERLGFCPAEIEALERQRMKLLDHLRWLRGRDLQCWCPLSSNWCHVDVLIEVANA